MSETLWRVQYDHENDGRAQRVFDAEDRVVAVPGWSGFTVEETNTNALKIAALPDMYEALASIENDAGQIPAWLWDIIQAALAKAEGGAS